MRKVVSLIVGICLLSQAAFADCDFSKGITPGPNKTFVYSEECHLKVGQLIQDNATKDAQIADLGKAIELKDLALTKSDARATLWMDRSQKLEDRVLKIDELQSKNNLLYYGLGILTVFAAGYLVRAAYH
jgi:hypothetical protein